MLEKFLKAFPEEYFHTIDGFNDAIIGLDITSMRVIYSISKCLDILMEKMSKEESLKYFENDVQNIYVGDRTPIWCNDIL
jgi:hypothetical protein